MRIPGSGAHFTTKARRTRRTTKPNPPPPNKTSLGCGFVVLRVLRAFVVKSQ